MRYSAKYCRLASGERDTRAPLKWKRTYQELRVPDAWCIPETAMQASHSLFKEETFGLECVSMAMKREKAQTYQ